MSKQKFLFSIVVSIWLSLAGQAVTAQQSTENPEPITTPPADTQANQAFAEMATRSAQAIESAESAAAQANQSAAEAANSIDRVLGIIEMVGVLVTVVAVFAGSLAILRDFRERANEKARNALTEAAQRFEERSAASLKGLEELRGRFVSEIDNVREEMQALKREILRSSENTSLSLSLMPLAERQYRVKDFDGALETYHQALKLDPENIVIAYRLGYVYTQYNLLNDATQYLEQALREDPNFAPALATLGYVKRRKAESMDESQIKRGEIMAEAEQYLRRALHISPKLVDEDGESWWGSLGGLHRRRGQIDDAIDAYSRALDVTPQASYPLGNLALLYMQKRERKLMLETYERVEVLAYRRTIADPTDFWAHADLLVARVALNKRDAAEEALIALFAATPLDATRLLESPLKTLRQLREAMGESEGLHIHPFIEKIEAFTLRQLAVADSQ